jgi:hypothetical protein
MAAEAVDEMGQIWPTTSQASAENRILRRLALRP